MRPDSTSSSVDELLTYIDSGLELSEASAVSVSPSASSSDLPQPTIMIVDDEPLTIDVITEHLKHAGYQNFLATHHAAHALAMILREMPDVVLLDVRMPQINGLDILKALRSDSGLSNIPVVVLTASTEDEVKVQALQLGATDVLHKPIHADELLARLKNTLLAKAYRDHLRDYSHNLELTVRQRTAELEISRREVIHCLARAAEFRDDDTGHHVIRVGRYARIIGAALGLDESALDLLEQAAKLHDIGKIGIRDQILLKPGRLTPEEFDLMQKHCNFGKRIIERMSDSEALQLRQHTELGAQILDSGRSPILELAVKIALTHHERWDGTGYPLGLAGEHIPLEGRITSVADVFDALSSKRPYKAALSLAESFVIMREGRGRQFDPKILDAFLARSDEIVQVQIAYADLE